MTDMTAEQAFKHLYQLCWNLPANDEHAAHELIDFLRQALTTPRVPNGETVTFWVVYDVTTDKKYIKKNADTGALAMFDYEHEALAVSLAHPGTGYRQVTYIKTDAAPAPAEPICKHCGNPTMHVGDVCYGCCQSTSEPTIAETFKRIGREIKIDDAKIMAMVDARYDAPAPADSELARLRDALAKIQAIADGYVSEGELPVMVVVQTICKQALLSEREGSQ